MSSPLQTPAEHAIGNAGTAGDAARTSGWWLTGLGVLFTFLWWLVRHSAKVGAWKRTVEAGIADEVEAREELAQREAAARGDLCERLAVVEGLLHDQGNLIGMLTERFAGEIKLLQQQLTQAREDVERLYQRTKSKEAS